MKDLKLLTITQAASKLGVNQKTLRRWADIGLVPHVKTFGGQRRFEASVIERVRRERGFTNGEEHGTSGDDLWVG